ncbi:Flap endonuclease 1-A [Ananas comosus]|uniref:Flap endonuclease 1-A n=1 Tax=Ananas comosus TaxID=4615 RepID=A0A199UCI4_ANACO|nr:Flap endonuclease 1-A [Ananas comosus]
MGIKGLTKLLADNAPKSMKEQKFESYFGRKIAIDASMSIYQFLIVVGRTGMETLTNEAGEVTRRGQIPSYNRIIHLQGMFNRTIRLLEAGIKPVFSKREDATKDLSTAIEAGDKESIEKFSKRTVKVTKQHNEDCKRLLRLMGVPIIEAPCEAEAECAALCKSDKAREKSYTCPVYAVASEDMDSLTFGAPRFLRHLMDPSSKKIPVMEFEIAKVLEELEFTMDQFIDLCILCGCDYCDSIKVCHKCILKSQCRYQIPEDWPYQEARRLFKEPMVSVDIPELKWTSPDEEGLGNFLVKENGFNQDRVTKAYWSPSSSQL